MFEKKQNEKKSPRCKCTALFFFLVAFFSFKRKKTISALQPLAIGDPTEVHCPQVCVCVCVCVRNLKVCQGHCAVVLVSV